MSPSADGGALAFAEKLLGLLGEGSFTATYKYAVILALVDLSIDGSTRTGSPPNSITTVQLAEKVVELYWPHTMPFRRDRVLKQNSGAGQANILTRIIRFRQEDCADSTGSLLKSRLAHKDEFTRMLREVEWTLVLMPLPKLQRVGDGTHPFIYEIEWDNNVTKGFFNGPLFDNVIRLKPRVDDYLVRLAGLIRPLVQREWAALVARFNHFERSELDEFLFGTQRKGLTPLRPDLTDLQSGRCFYCAHKLEGASEVDHFVPWSRYPDNGVSNLVVAHRACNNAKRDHLASADHVDAWIKRSSSLAVDLDLIARTHTWDWHPDRTTAVARSIYLRLPEDAPLWQESKTFVPLDRALLVKSFAGTPRS